VPAPRNFLTESPSPDEQTGFNFNPGGDIAVPGGVVIVDRVSGSALRRRSRLSPSMPPIWTRSCVGIHRKYVRLRGSFSITLMALSGFPTFY
jgi:hypothetical protein